MNIFYVSYEYVALKILMQLLQINNMLCLKFEYKGNLFCLELNSRNYDDINNE